MKTRFKSGRLGGYINIMSKMLRVSIGKKVSQALLFVVDVDK